MLTAKQYIATELSKRLLERTSVNFWKDEAERTSLAEAAVAMAEIIAPEETSSVANKIYQATETSIVFGSEVGDDVAWSTESVANGAGRQSAFHDLGTSSRAREYRYRYYTQNQATPTLNAANRLYAKTSDGTHPDNDDGTGDAAVSAEAKLANLTPLRSALVDEAAANIEFVSKGSIGLDHRYIAFVSWNAAGSSVTADAAETKLVLTPVPSEVQ